MAKGESPTHTQTPHTLLVVDDERSLRFTIGEWARDLGFTPLEAASGAEALDRLREHGVDVVLLDLKLTNEDGMEVLKRVREEDAALPVIMLTGHGERSRVIEAIRLGVNEFLLKPVSSTALRERLIAVLANPRPMVRQGDYYGPLPRKLLPEIHDDADQTTARLYFLN